MSSVQIESWSRTQSAEKGGERHREKEMLDTLDRAVQLEEKY